MLPSHWLSGIDSLLAPCGAYLSSKLGLSRLPEHFTLVVLSALTFHIIQLLSGVFSRVIFPKTYGNLKKNVRSNWDAHVVSMAHAVTIIPLAYSFKMKGSPSLEEDHAFGWDPEIGSIIGISIGYFMWDSIHCILDMTDFGFIVHATLCLAVYLNGYRPFLAYYACSFLLWELSTPFLNIHWFLDKLGMTGGFFQLINSAVLLVSFFGARLVFGTYSSYEFINTMQELKANHQISTIFYAAYLFGNVSLNLLNWIWFFKMIKALRKRFSKTTEPRRNGTGYHGESANGATKQVANSRSKRKVKLA
ncbi:TLC domain-containing protein [Cantharellus anzutake]|uniref:TLC domain-containing protein n=1 Tax=Cantharellus anzutake TaxID=1750568 RepID=UPI001903ED57|nr:TLC domain-containing protein [Cantharellus anzutake]KAF8334217.1 TLC domain-containing protein [Cantharellus anzutake]